MPLHLGLVPDEALEQSLAQLGITWEVIPDSRHAALQAKWESIYGEVWRLKLPHKRGAGAQAQYFQHSGESFLIVPFLGNHAGPIGVGEKGPRTAAYECHGRRGLPDLSSFSNLDFFVSPPGLSWTMVHTHEDFVLGGPYFVEKDLLVGPIRKLR